jgi:beta-lactamase superfamily II metal-dependent hydrolase
MEINDYEITMLDVGAADAFVIHFVDDKGRERVVLVDAGNYSDGQAIIDYLRSCYADPVIDLAIVTHPDDDHYGGFVKILEKIQAGDDDHVKINNFWINVPEDRKVYDFEGRNLVALIDGLKITRKGKFSGVSRSKEGKLVVLLPDRTFPCCTILGPTKDYYDELIPAIRDENLNFKRNDSDRPKLPKLDLLSPTLDAADDDPSASNQSSLIFLFEPVRGKKYLFMGDAGRDAFNHIPLSLKDKIKDVFLLKVPHHGSKHNLDSIMINHLNPEIAFISTEKTGKYLDQCTVNALKESGCTVYSTHKDRCGISHLSEVRLLAHGAENDLTATPV